MGRGAALGLARELLPTPVHAEPVEALSFSSSQASSLKKKVQSFDKLRTNG